MALLDEPDVGCQSGEVALACRQSLERFAGAQAHAVTGHGAAGDRAEDPAEVVGRDETVKQTLESAALDAESEIGTSR